MVGRLVLSRLNRAQNACRRKYSRTSLSHFSGPTDVPLKEQTIGQLIDLAAQQYPDGEAVVSCHQNIRRTFSEVKEEAERLAAGFLQLGLKRRDRIGIWGPNSFQWYLTQLAAAKAGLILVNVNPAYQPDELLCCLNKVGMRALVSAERFRTQDYHSILTAILPGITSAGSEIKEQTAPSLRRIVMISDKQLPGCVPFNEVMGLSSEETKKEMLRASAEISPYDACNIQFTSGTTGSPKAAALSHHNQMNNAYFIGRRIGYGQSPHRICMPVPLFHSFGCVGGTLTGLAYGATAIMSSEGFDAEAALWAVHEEKASSLYGTPTMFVDMLNVQRRKKYDLSSLVTGMLGGSPCPVDLILAIMNELNMKEATNSYGLTETSPIICQALPTDTVEDRSQTVGFPLNHTQIKVVDDKGDTVPINTPGELWSKGFGNFLGYWNDEDKTKEAVTEDGWLQTGDLAVLDERGYARIVGRKKDTVIRGGENVYPAEIENFLHTHPAIAEAHVIGVPDDRLGEEVCAWVKIKEGHQLNEKELRKYCEGKLAKYKIPRHVRFRGDFPKTASGKIQKFVMRKIEMTQG